MLILTSYSHESHMNPPRKFPIVVIAMSGEWKEFVAWKHP